MHRQRNAWEKVLRMTKVCGIRWIGRFFYVFMLTALTSGATAWAARIAWDPSPDPSVTGYIVHLGPNSRTYPIEIDVGAATSYSLSGLPPGKTHYIAVTAYDAAGRESSYSNEVSATESLTAPVATFHASVTSGTAPLLLNFINASTGTITGYAWTFGDGTSSASENPSKAYTSPGVYTVSLQVTGPAGTHTQTKTDYITITGSGDTTPPSAPLHVRARAITSNAISVSWTAATDDVGVASYRLERCQDASCVQFTQIAT